MYLRRKNAFTLLELLVVMAIMAILTVLGIRSFGSIQIKSRDSHRKQDMQSISKALELYYNDLSDAEGKSFSLFTYLENTEDSDVVTNLGGEPAFYSGTSCRIIDGMAAVDSCNYVIMSSNLITTPEVVDGS